jgi:pSer/pThr/pTyr-binding forkhead associated (FHA) protein
VTDKLENPLGSLTTFRRPIRQSEHVSTGPQPPTGERIALEVEREMEERLYRLRHVVLAPAEYHIYLHPDDFKHIEDVASRIALDVQLCLNSLVERLNKRSRLSALVTRRRAPIEIPAGGWAIYLKPALNQEVGPGELGIHSRLSVPSAARFGSGAGTTRIVQTVVSGTDRRSTVKNELDGAPKDPTGAPSASLGPEAAVSSSRPHRPASRPAARLSYTDERGAQGFVIAKELIKIGRGGNAHWVDLTLVTSPKVSREHCRIRRDSSGRFFIQDVSAWGTFLNGTQVPKFVDGQPAHATERELTDGASIRLADAVTIEFRLE